VGSSDQLRANSSLTAQEYSRPVLGLIFLKYADHRFTAVEKDFKEKKAGGRRTIQGVITLIVRRMRI
jgi:type I restriction enzyme M protein